MKELTKEKVDLIPLRRLLAAIPKHNHVDGSLQVAEADGGQGDGELRVNLERVEHTRETGVGGHLEGDGGGGEEGAGALVDGCVEGG